MGGFMVGWVSAGRPTSPNRFHTIFLLPESPDPREGKD